MIIKAITKIIGGDFAKSSLVMSDLSMMSCIHFIGVMSFLHHKIVLNCGFLISIDTTRVVMSSMVLPLMANTKCRIMVHCLSRVQVSMGCHLVFHQSLSSPMRFHNVAMIDSCNDGYVVWCSVHTKIMIVVSTSKRSGMHQISELVITVLFMGERVVVARLLVCLSVAWVSLNCGEAVQG